MVPASLNVSGGNSQRTKSEESERPDEAVNQHGGAISTNRVEKNALLRPARPRLGSRRLRGE